MADEPTPDPKDDPKPDPTPDPTPDPPDPKDEVEKWKALSRKNEKAAEKERKEREKAEAALKERDDADKSEQDKAIDAAREAGRTEAMTEAEKERRGDRLEVAVTRLAAKGVTVGEGDDKKVVRFADAEDALVHIQRGDTEDVFDDEGKVKTEALTEALVDLLGRKPHLAANGETPAGDPDTRKGDPAASDLEAMTPEDHAKRKYAQK